MGAKRMYGLLQEQWKTIYRIFNLHRDALHWVKLFGSRARGDHRTASDIDLAVAGKGGIRERLARAFDESALPYTFDIVDYENLSNAHLRHAVDTDGVLLWKKEDGAAWNEKGRSVRQPCTWR